MDVQKELREIFNTDYDCLLADFPVGNKFVIDGKLMEVVGVEFTELPEYSTYLYTLRGDDKVMQIFERDLWHTLDKSNKVNIKDVLNYYTDKIERRKFRIVNHSTSLVRINITDDDGNDVLFVFWYNKGNIKQEDVYIKVPLTEKAIEVLNDYFID